MAEFWTGAVRSSRNYYITCCYITCWLWARWTM
jgi:hypothetical protein